MITSLILWTAVSIASTKSSPPALLLPFPGEMQPKSIDVIKAQFKKKKPLKGYQRLAKAYDLYTQKKLSTAASSAAALAADGDVGDYAFYLAALSYKEAAKSELLAKKLPEAREQARKAINSLAQVTISQPYSALIGKIAGEIAECEVIIGDSYFDQKKWTLAQTIYEKALQRNSDSKHSTFAIRPRSLVNYANTCKRKGSELCNAWLWKLTGAYPSNSFEFKSLIKERPDLKNRSKAPPASGRIAQYYRSQSEDLDGAAIDEAIGLAVADKRVDARKALESFLEKYPRSVSKNRARYWLGLGYSRDGDTEKSKKYFDLIIKDGPLSYYGLLSAQALNKPIQNPFSNTSPSASERDPFLNAPELFRLKRAEQFLIAKIDLFAASELSEIRFRGHHSSSFLLYLALLNHLANNHSMTFSILTELTQRGDSSATTLAFTELAFPTTLRSKVETKISKYAKLKNLDPVLIISLIKQESGFDAAVHSPIGAQGLMQLMPATAADVIKEVERADLTQVDRNLEIGTEYLRQLMDRFQGNIVYSLAAYNAGPAAVNRWIKQQGQSKGILEFVEQIPYRETRDYVAGIIRNYYWYAPRLKAETPKTLAFFWPDLSKPIAPVEEDTGSGDESTESDE